MSDIITFVLGIAVIPMARLKATKTGKSQKTRKYVSEERLGYYASKPTDGLLNHTILL